jgi:hypothetical protein
VLALPIGQDDAVPTVGGASDDLEPAVRVADVDEGPVGQPLRAGVVAVRTRHDLAVPARDIDDRDLPRREVVGRLLTGHGDAPTVG